MMRQALAICFADPTVHTILVDPLASNTSAHRFYGRCGFRFIQERWFGEDSCHVFALTRELGTDPTAPSSGA
jgi:aminoglycoside 6'-N-acetyltransferase